MIGFLRTPLLRLPLWFWLVLLGLGLGQLGAESVDWRFPGLLNHYAWMQPGLIIVALVLGLLGLLVRRRWWSNLMFQSSGAWFYGILCTAALALYLVVALIIYDGIPRIDDGAAAVFQSRIFLSGQVVLSPPVEPDFFQLNCTIGPWSKVDPAPQHWCGMYAPGWSILAMPFEAAGIVWLLNPLLGMLLIPAIGWLGTEIYGHRVGRIAALLTVSSPFVAALSGTHLGHNLTALCLVICAAAVWRMLRTRVWWLGLVAGLAFHLGFLTRSVTTLLVGLLIGLMVLVRWKEALTAWRPILLAGVLGASAAGTLGWYQTQTTGDWKTAGHKVGMGPFAKLGFHTFEFEKDDFWRHSPTKAVRMTLGRLQGANEKMVALPIGLFILVLLPWLYRRGSWTQIWLIIFPVLPTMFFALFWYEEVYWRARYLFGALPFLLVAGAFGIHCLVEHSTRWRLPLVFAGAFTLAVAIPAELLQIQPRHGDVENNLKEILAEAQLDNAIVLMSHTGVDEVKYDGKNDYFATGWIRNNVTLDTPILFARDLGERNPELLRHYPDRDVYHYLYHRDIVASELTDARGNIIASRFRN